jgi:anti-sigma B factor antagonist
MPSSTRLWYFINYFCYSFKTISPQSSMALQIKYDTLPNKSLRVTLTGRLDAVTSDQLDQFITTQTAQPIENLIFNLQNLQFVSSAGLRIFAKSRKLMKAKKGKTLFINLQPQVQKVFDLVKAVQWTMYLPTIRS